MTMKVFMSKGPLYYMLFIMYYKLVTNVVTSNPLIFVYSTTSDVYDGIYNYNYHVTLRLWETLLAPDFFRKSELS